MTQTQTQTEAWTESKDGTRLFYRRWPVDEPKASILIVHGYADHSGRYEHVAELLNGLGVDVFAIDVRGHGKSDGPRGYIDRFSNYLEDVEAGLARVKEESAAPKRFILGHSNGGLLVLNLLATRDADLEGAIVTSPFLGMATAISPVKAWLGRVMSVIHPKLVLPTGIDPADLSHDPEVGKAYSADPLVFSTATARWFTETEAAWESTFAAAGKFTTPVLMMIAGDDKLVDASRANPLFETLGSGDKKFIEYPAFYHEILNEAENEKPLGEIEKWLRPRIGD